MHAGLIVEREETVTRLLLDRPESRNALSAVLVEALLEALAVAAQDGTRLLVLRGSGKAFCAGFDFGGIEQSSDGDLVRRFIRIEQMLQALQHAPFATLALVHGACFGAGADMVAACGTRIAAPGTRFRMPGLRFGVVLGTRRLAMLVGRDAARELLAVSAVFDAQRALELGVLNALHAEAEWGALESQAAVVAHALPEVAQHALFERTVEETRDADLAALVRSVSAPGLRERIQAFLAEARTPG